MTDLTDGDVNPFFLVMISLPHGHHLQDTILISSFKCTNGVPEIHWPVNILFSNLASASPQLPEVNISQTLRQSHITLVSWKSVLWGKQNWKLKRELWMLLCRSLELRNDPEDFTKSLGKCNKKSYYIHCCNFSNQFLFSIKSSMQSFFIPNKVVGNIQIHSTLFTHSL